MIGLQPIGAFDRRLARRVDRRGPAVAVFTAGTAVLGLFAFRLGLPVLGQLDEPIPPEDWSMPRSTRGTWAAHRWSSPRPGRSTATRCTRSSRSCASCAGSGSGPGRTAGRCTATRTARRGSPSSSCCTTGRSTSPSTRGSTRGCGGARAGPHVRSCRRADHPPPRRARRRRQRRGPDRGAAAHRPRGAAPSPTAACPSTRSHLTVGVRRAAGGPRAENQRRRGEPAPAGSRRSTSRARGPRPSSESS
jgi:hypothetical protein